MTKFNFYLNCDRGSKRKDAFQFAAWCIERGIEMDKLSHNEFVKAKMEFDKTHFNKVGYHPTENDLTAEEQ